MNIRALRSVTLGGGRCLGPGESADVNNEVAALLVSMGKAVRVASPMLQQPGLGLVEMENASARKVEPPRKVHSVIETASVAPNHGATKAKKTK